VAVHTVEHHSLTVDGEGAVITDSHLAEAYLRTADIDGLTLGVLHHQHKVIEVGLFGAPQLRSANVHTE